jgi:hypothetical protein
MKNSDVAKIFHDIADLSDEEEIMATLKKERFITDDKGRKKAVILDIKLYQELLEDLEDLRLLAERRDEATSSLQEVEERLKARGLL